MDTTTTESTISITPTATQPARRQFGMPEAVVAWLRLARIYQKIDRRTAATLKSWNLSVSRFDVLNHAGAEEGRSQQELADVLLVTKGNITQLLDAMEREGLVERRRIGRTNHIYLTECGRELRANSLREHEARICDEFSVLTAEEQATLLRILRKLDRSLPGPD